MSDRLLAYAVLELGENTGTVVFAKTNAAARRIGSSQISDGSFFSVSAHRAPWADRYAPGPVPIRVMIDNGWWWECFGCHRHIGLDIAPPIERSVEIGGHIYCSQECLDAKWAAKLVEQWIRIETIAALESDLRRKMPGVVFGDYSHVYVPCGTWSAKRGIISFDFPGRKYDLGNYRFDGAPNGDGAPQVFVSYGDRGAFEAWRDAGYPQWNNVTGSYPVERSADVGEMA